jgi:cysteine desulfurase/selenocysteine lyase
MKNYRLDFPIFQNHPDLVYLDSASTSQKPQSVIDAISHFYAHENSNVHRSIYQLSEIATNLYEEARNSASQFLNTKHTQEIVFTKGSTESVNLVAATWGEENITSGDEIIVSSLEHHANYLPWFLLAQKKNAQLKMVPLTEDFSFDYPAFEKLLSSKTKLVAITGMSNVTGEVIDLDRIIKFAHQVGAKVFIDAAQLAAHSKINVQNLDCDFLTFSGHKIFGPTGTGILYGKADLLEKMPPYQTGGSMIKEIEEDNLIYHQAPQKFEAGTPNIAGFVGLKAAFDYLANLDQQEVSKNEKSLFNKTLEILKKYPQIKTFTTPTSQSIISFAVDGIHPHDLASIFDSENIAIRAGHHCAKPLMKSLNINATARISFSVYNEESELEKFEKALEKSFKIFS